MAHHHGLADVEGADLLGDLEAEVDVLQLCLGGGALAQFAGRGQEFVQKEGGGGDGDAFGLEFGGHRLEEAVVLAGPGPADDAQGAEVRAELPEEAAPGDAPGHHGPLHPGGLEDADHLAQLADVDPVDFVHQVGQGGIGLMPVGHGDDPGPVVPGGLGEEPRELAFTRD